MGRVQSCFLAELDNQLKKHMPKKESSFLNMIIHSRSEIKWKLDLFFVTIPLREIDP